MLPNGKTIHSLLVLPVNYRPKDPSITSVEKYMAAFYAQPWKRPFIARARKLLKSITTIVIDECSYLLPVTVHLIDNALRRICKVDKPFGGITIVFCGDMLQLQAVRTSHDILNSIVVPPNSKGKPPVYNFETVLTESFEVVRLTEIFRQTNRAFIDMLQRMAVNALTKQDLEALNSRVVPPRNGNVKLAVKRDIVRGLNSLALNSLLGEEKKFLLRKDDSPSNRARVQLLIEEHRLAERLRVKSGMRVMVTRNLGDGWVNGTLGHVVGVDEEHIDVMRDSDCDVLRLGYEKYVYEEGDDSKGYVFGVPLEQADALTVHKSQGQTFKSVHYVTSGGLGGMSGVGYVALSRVARLEDITLSRKVMGGLGTSDPKLIRFARGE